MSIPIKNIYYLLCYAWDRMQEKDIIEIDDSDYEQLPELLAKVLVTGCNRLAKQGLDHDYVATSKIYNGIKGKLEFAPSIKSQSFRFGKSFCTYDEFTSDILTNQLLKGTLKLLLRIPNMEKSLTEDVRNTLKVFADVSDIEPRKKYFTTVKIHRNNGFYSFLLNICEMVLENIALDERQGEYKFKDPLRDLVTMQYLFEEFVRNFYTLKQNKFDVKRQVLSWQVSPINNGTVKYLPSMKTDTSLLSEDKVIVIDTKYYQDTLTSNQFSSQKFHSTNLYQIFAYIKNIKLADQKNRTIHGILLYPTTNAELGETYSIDNHLLSIFTVNLANDWRIIENRLLNIIT